MKIKLGKIEQGVCPYCGSVDIDYGVMEIEDDCVYYPAHCNDCKRDFNEWYRLEFDGHNVGDRKDIPCTPTDEGKVIEMVN